MFRHRNVVTRFALGIIAVENIKKPACACYWHKVGKPEFCSRLDQHLEDDFAEECMSRHDDWPDDYPDEGGDWDGPCHCYWCRTGEPQKCVSFSRDDDDDLGIFAGMDDAWDDIDCTLVFDGAVAFDDVPEPPVRVSKFHRINRLAKLDHLGIVVVGYGRLEREERSRKHEERKKCFMNPRRNRARIGMVLAHEESLERSLQEESDARYWRAWYPEDHAELQPEERVELLERNFPGLSSSSARHIASSWRIQASSTMKGLERLQQCEVEEERRNAEYFRRIDECDFDQSMDDLHELVDLYNRITYASLSRCS